MHTAQLRRLSRGYGVRIPKEIIDQVGLTEGTQFVIHPDKEGILMIPIQAKRTLEELLEGITPEKLHGEVEWGESVGKEVW